MEKLIKIQSVIMEIEQLKNLKTELRTIFNYKNDEILEIECFSRQHAMNIMSTLGETEDTTWYFKNNTKIKIIDWTKFK